MYTLVNTSIINNRNCKSKAQLRKISRELREIRLLYSAEIARRKSRDLGRGYAMWHSRSPGTERAGKKSLNLC